MKFAALSAALLLVAGGIFLYFQDKSRGSSAEWKEINDPALGVSFEVPGNWNLEDHTNDTGELWLEKPESRGDGVDGYSFTLVVATTSTRFPKFVSLNTPEEFDAMLARRPGTMENGTTGESYTKLTDMTISGYPAIHFQIVGATSKERGTRDLEDGLWIRAHDKNLLFYFASVDTAKRYTFYSEANLMKTIFESIKVTP